MTYAKNIWLILGLLIIFGITFFSTYFPSANDLPRGVHQWAQADRLALCYRFIDGKNLTQPATLSLKTTDGDVGVECSVFQYAFAQVIRLGFPKRYLPFLYKFFSFSMFFVALSLLVSQVLKKENVLSILFFFVVLFSSPLLLFYGYNYLPDIWALSLILFSLYFFHKGLTKNIFFILFICGLSSLIKTSSGIYFIAIFGVYFLQNVAHPTRRFWFVSTLFICIASFVVFYDIYFVAQVNKRLWSTVFLSKTMAVDTWDTYWLYIKTAWRFKYDYLSTAQRWFFILIVAGGIALVFKKGLSSRFTQFFILLLLGLLCITVLFGVQFTHHDYYVLGTLFPGLLFSFLLVSSHFLPFVHPYTSASLLGLVAFFSYSEANSRYFARMSEIVHINNYPENYERDWLLGADIILDQYASPEDAIYVCYVHEPNLSLIYFNRKGATFNPEEMSRSESPFRYFLPQVNPKFIALKTEYKNQLMTDIPELAEQAFEIYSDQNISIYQMKSKNGYPDF